jgi:diguanylate cyclase (GGDEF)-like protein
MGINLRKNKVLTKKQKQLRKLSSEDTLTGTYNRATFNRKLNQAINLKTDKKQLALLFIDLDDFKNINDSYGHDSGDTVLRIVATRLNYFLREKDFVARMGGDEFVIVLNNIESKKDIENIIGRILELFKDPIKLTKDRTITQTVSIGVAISPKDCHTKADELLVQADIAMYKAKNAGKNSYQFFDKEND